MPDLDFNPALLFAEGERLPKITSWLTDTVWAESRYQKNEPEAYLRTGEMAVYHLEELIATGALTIWDELEADSRRAPTLKSWLGIDAALPLTTPHAGVVFDGLSLRELPLLLRLAAATGFRVKSLKIITTCLPSETVHYVEQRVLGTQLAPSRLRERAELAEKNVETFYLEQPNSRANYPADCSLLIWSSYPDRLFFNDEARSESLFTTFHKEYIPTIWKCAVQSIPGGMPIVVTSDHGYIFFGAGVESTHSNSDAARLLDQSRVKQFREEEPFPEWNPDLQLLPRERLAMLRGRIRAHPQGPASRKLYQHGGFSLMEMLAPWIELEKIS